MSANTFKIPYGDGTIAAQLPERTRVIRNTNTPRPAIPDVAQAVRDALNSPIAHDPLSKLVNSKSKVTIAFDDPIVGVIPGQEKNNFFKVTIKVLLEELDKLGVEQSNIRLVCAPGLHPRATTQELSWYIGEELAYNAWPSKLYNHDAMDPEQLVFLGETEGNQEVEINRVTTDSDQLIYIGRPPITYCGGWKSVTVGLGSYRSIRHHHRPTPWIVGQPRYDPKLSDTLIKINEMGALIEKELAKSGRRVFLIEGTMNNAVPPEIVHVVAGHPLEVHEPSLEVLYQQQRVDVKGQCDVLVYGLSNARDGYSKFSFINPILVRNLATQRGFGNFFNVPLVKPGGIIITCHPCRKQFDIFKHASYPELFEKVIPYVKDSIEVWDRFAEDFAYRPEFAHKYRYAYAFHGAHPVILWGQGVRTLRYVSKVFLAGATDFETARQVGFEPFATVEEAVAEAENLMGKDCSITYLDLEQELICRVEP